MIYRTVRDDERTNGLPANAVPIFTRPVGEPEWVVPFEPEYKAAIRKARDFLIALDGLIPSEVLSFDMVTYEAHAFVLVHDEILPALGDRQLFSW